MSLKMKTPRELLYFSPTLCAVLFDERDIYIYPFSTQGIKLSLASEIKSNNHFQEEIF